MKQKIAETEDDHLNDVNWQRTPLAPPFPFLSPFHSYIKGNTTMDIFMTSLKFFFNSLFLWHAPVTDVLFPVKSINQDL